MKDKFKNSESEKKQVAKNSPPKDEVKKKTKEVLSKRINAIKELSKK